MLGAERLEAGCEAELLQGAKVLHELLVHARVGHEQRSPLPRPPSTPPSRPSVHPPSLTSIAPLPLPEPPGTLTPMMNTIAPHAPPSQVDLSKSSAASALASLAVLLVPLPPSPLSLRTRTRTGSQLAAFSSASPRQLVSALTTSMVRSQGQWRQLLCCHLHHP